MRKINSLLLFAAICISFASCESYYYCTVNAYGEQPRKATYYLVPIDSSMYANPFQYREYKNVLNTRLRDLGYIETDSANAALVIYWGYYFGDRYFAGTSSSQMTNNYGIVNSNTTSNTSASAYGRSTTNRYNNNSTTNASAYGTARTNTNTNVNTHNFSVTTSSEDAVYQYDLGCTIMACEKGTNEPIWMVETIDHTRQVESMREAMKWAITAACMRIGQNNSGEVRIDELEGQRLGLKYPYH